MNDSSPASSPLDPFLARFLAAIQESDGDFQPGVESRDVATALDLPVSFVDALFTSARTRGLLKPVYSRGGKVRWSVSPTGKALLRANQAAGEPGSA